MLLKTLNIFYLTIVIFSKEVIVFNEEILILFAFTLFIYLISTKASSFIVSDLDANILSIKNKFLTYKNLKEKSVLYAISYIQRQNLLSSKLQNLLKLRIIYINKLITYSNNIFKQLIIYYIRCFLVSFVINEEDKMGKSHLLYVDIINQLGFLMYATVKIDFDLNQSRKKMIPKAKSRKIK